MKRAAIIALTLAVAAFLFGCTHKISNRYRLTVEVETPEGVKSGSGVIDVERRILYSWVPSTPEMRREEQFVTGEAISVDLGKRGILFVLLTCRDPKNNPEDCNALKLPERVLRRRGEVSIRPAKGQSNTDWLIEKALSVAAALGPRPVSIEDLPMMVRFGDLNVPKSVAAVDPESLAKSFGEGVKLGAVTVEMTDAPVTTGIEQKLQWLVGFKGSLAHPGREGGVRTSNDLAASLGLYNFKQGG
jgi:hypothetical protein